ncbi:hypothetical protein CK203_074120 [Vitis vinifera]|uniref:Retrotransposon gag domain-containing protein n=1 Tax=Vitis vinifera TaxID=29760 RepID=A0A438E7K8_VITVI|nr:hypothetical protein CK203_074120 [Vitis vinifera]
MRGPHLPTAQEIWSALSKVFYDGSDELQVFTLNQKAFTAKQNGRSLSEYHGELTEIFCELDHRDKDHNRDQRKKDSKKTSTAAVAEIKTEANVAKKASALVAATDYGGLTP